ncbi:UDP-glucuronic acid decarboxylase family protein [Allosalinactinospora lopnorensis]|uniref:UDP-glucuronic acid decarboxylase family protein n=1 Tax=Allosalinactinospora lopnorensis TaxID=1352348 RepID=UPI000623E041|nr:UDP-glucuronic acid decarboxylase family protein [Allosalinactinospora lopnorensis]
MSGREIRRAMVTGGAGFLGSHVCERLLARDVSVVCMDNFLTSGPDNIDHLLDHRSFRLVECDLTSFVHVPGEVDLVFHLASAASPADYLRYPVETLRVGSMGTAHALGLAREKEARFVLASTSEVYGDPLVHPQPETYWGNVNPVGPRSVYDEAKRYAESLTTAYRNARGTDTAIARIFNSYGPRMRPDDGRAIPTFIGQALDRKPLTVTGDGSQTRSVCYVDDTVAGLLALAYSGVPGPVNIGSAQECTVRELAELIRDIAGSSSELEFVDRPVDDPAVRCPDTALAREQLGWWPRVALADGLARTVAWFAAAPSGRHLQGMRQAG